MDSQRIGKGQALSELFFAAILWGFGFVATRWALDSFGPSWTSSLRFLLAGFGALPFIFLSNSYWPYLTWHQARLSLLPGIFIGATLLSQCYGLQFTTITKSGFITILYIVFVPLFEWYLLGRRSSIWQVVHVLIALIGAALMCQLEGGQWNRGDLLTLFSAILAAIHILLVERIADEVSSALVFNVLQSLWAGLLLLLPAILSHDRFDWPPTGLSLIGITIIAYGATLVAFMIQVRTQQVLRPSLVSLLFLLESPFAALFAYLIFGESLTSLQWSGAILILGAAVSQVFRVSPESNE